MSTSARINPLRSATQGAAWTALAVVVVVVVAFIVDTVAASRAEHHLATVLQESPGVTFEPEVTITGTPFLTRASSGRFPRTTISARGVGIDGCADRGACTVTVDAQLADVDAGNVWQIGPTTPITVADIRAETRIDSVNLGRLMGITDLYINTPAPEGKVGGGGPNDGLLERTDGIMLSGTVPLPGSPEHDGRFPPSASGYRFDKVKISVSARVFVQQGRVHIVATDIYDGPEEHYAADLAPEFYSHVLSRFSTVLQPLPMAWNITPNNALSRGSDLIVAGTGAGRVVKPVDFVNSAHPTRG